MNLTSFIKLKPRYSLWPYALYLTKDQIIFRQHRPGSEPGASGRLKGLMFLGFVLVGLFGVTAIYQLSSPTPWLSIPYGVFAVLSLGISFWLKSMLKKISNSPVLSNQGWSPTDTLYVYDKSSRNLTKRIKGAEERLSSQTPIHFSQGKIGAFQGNVRAVIQLSIDNRTYAVLGVETKELAQQLTQELNEYLRL